MIIWFDIDNTLYSAKTGIAQEMGKRIHEYFLSMGFEDPEEAKSLHLKYFLTYGLALRGLTKHHDIDPIDFDRKCDGTLPLEEMISRNESLIRLFKDIDRTKARVWALTNAYRPHALRVLKILGLDDQIEDIVYCDYTRPEFPCKPEPEYYHEALAKAGVTDPSKCYFIDDNRKNVDAARKLGWNCIHFCEEGIETMEGGQIKRIENERSPTDTPRDCIQSIVDLEELRKVWPHIFKQ
jgi:pyrimidine and pyridine-specific 5'-nucleotidase